MEACMTAITPKKLSVYCVTFVDLRAKDFFNNYFTRTKTEESLIVKSKYELHHVMYKILLH